MQNGMIVLEEMLEHMPQVHAMLKAFRQYSDADFDEILEAAQSEYTARYDAGEEPTYSDFLACVEDARHEFEAKAQCGW